VTGLPSLESPTFAGPAAGPQHVPFQGRGGMYVTIGFGGPPSQRNELPGVGSSFGQLLKITPSGASHSEADISAYENRIPTTPSSTPIYMACSRCRDTSW
jgi:hypothetical protein